MVGIRYGPIATPPLMCGEVLGVVALPCGRMKYADQRFHIGITGHVGWYAFGWTVSRLIASPCGGVRCISGLHWLGFFYGRGPMAAPPCAVVWLNMLQEHVTEQYSIVCSEGGVGVIIGGLKSTRSVEFDLGLQTIWACKKKKTGKMAYNLWAIEMR